MRSVRCPDYSVTMRETTVRGNDGMRLRTKSETRDGLLGKLGIGTSTKLEVVCCPECGLVRLYADPEDGD